MALLAKKAVQELCLKIDCALQPEGRRRLGPPGVRFLSSIRDQLSAPPVRLSKKQLDVTDKILVQASSGEPVVLLDDQALQDLVRLYRHATGDDGRISSFEQ